MSVYQAIASYLPHSGKMVLIDEIIEVGEDFIITKSIVKNHIEFCEMPLDSSKNIRHSEPLGEESKKDLDKCVDSSFTYSLKNDNKLAFPTYKSIELMAQSLGIFRGLKQKGSGGNLGFLLGARRFNILRPYIINEAQIKVTISMQDESGMGVYDCEIIENDALIATASISALNPSDNFLSQIKGDL